MGAEKGHTLHALSMREHMNWILGVEREELIEPGFSHHHELSVFFDTNEARKWLSMELIKVNISLILILLYALMSTCNPMWFKVFTTPCCP